MKDVGRNDPCPCNSGKKFKQCCALKAQSLPVAPATVDHYRLAMAAKDRGDFNELVRQLNAHVAQKGVTAALANDLAIACSLAGQLSQAKAHFKQAIVLKPRFAPPYRSLAYLCMEEGLLDEAVAYARQALAIDPGFVDAYCVLGDALVKQGRDREALAPYRRALKLEPGLIKIASGLLALLQLDAATSVEDLRAQGRKYADGIERPLVGSRQAHANGKDRDRRLRIGYVSPNFYAHPVGLFIEPLLAQRNRAQVEVICYYHGLFADATTRDLQKHSDVWVDCAAMTDQQLYACIKSQEIDILVDLAGHTADNRLPVFARKPAPVQVTYLGYSGSSWLAAMDYRISDWCADPAGSEAWYSEKLLRLPDSLYCYRPLPDMPAVTPLPAMENGHVTFGSFANYNKIDDACLKLWSAVLLAVPNSRLLMATIPTGEPRAELLKKFAALGIAASRIDLFGRLERDAFHALAQTADIALDTLTINSSTTTCELLWLGLPVVTRIGSRTGSRVGFSVLSAAGCQAMATDTDESYVQNAVALAGDLDGLVRTRQQLRPQLAGSALTDAARFTRNLEQLYREIWQKWCDG